MNFSDRTLGTSEQVIRRWVRRHRLTRRTILERRSGRPRLVLSRPGYRCVHVRHDLLVTEVVLALRSFATCRFLSGVSFEGVVPDLTFTLTHGQKTCLFFVEVDCGTEPLARNGEGSDLLGKIRAYRRVRALGEYERLGTTSHGFRVLVVPHDNGSRLSALVETTGNKFVHVVRLRELTQYLSGAAGLRATASSSL